MTVKIWNPATYCAELTLSGHDGVILSLYQLLNGFLCSGSADETVRIWDVVTGACVGAVNWGGPVYCMTQMEAGKLFGGDYLGFIRLYCCHKIGFDYTLQGHHAPSELDTLDYPISNEVERLTVVRALVGLPDTRLCSAGDDGTVRIWDTKQGSCEAILLGHEGPVRCLALLMDGRVCSGSEDKTVRVWDINGKICDVLLKAHTAGVWAVTQLADGRVCSGSDDFTLKLWDVSTSACVCTLVDHKNYVSSVVELPDGRLCSASWDKHLKIWGVANKLPSL
jgi:WD40 repeat protein